MEMIAAGLAAVLMFVTPAPSNSLDCGWMSGESVSGVPAILEAVLSLAHRGEFSRAFGAFEETVSEFSREGERLLFNGQPGDAREARRFMDSYLQGTPSFGVVRKDQLSLSPDVVAFGAWLGCKAGARDRALMWLRVAWRDWGDRRFLRDAALLLVSLGDYEGAGRFVSANPVGVEEQIAAGLLYCTRGEEEAGAELLKRVLPRIKDDHGKKRLETLLGGCRQQRRGPG